MLEEQQTIFLILYPVLAQIVTQLYKVLLNDSNQQRTRAWQITQSQGETVNEFYRRLKEKASKCEFVNEEKEIRTQIIHKAPDTRLSRKVLREQMDLKAALAYGF